MTGLAPAAGGGSPGISRGAFIARKTIAAGALAAKVETVWLETEG
jgi:hypothetical protein